MRNWYCHLLYCILADALWGQVLTDSQKLYDQAMSAQVPMWDWPHWVEATLNATVGASYVSKHSHVLQLLLWCTPPRR